MGDNLSWFWAIITGISSISVIVVPIILFICHNHKQKSYKFKLSIIKSCLNGPELEVDFKLENRSINNIYFKEASLELLSSKDRIEKIFTISVYGNFLRQRGILFAGGSHTYGGKFRAVDPSKMNEGIDRYKLYIYSEHSNKPISKVGKIYRESKQD